MIEKDIMQPVSGCKTNRLWNNPAKIINID